MDGALEGKTIPVVPRMPSRGTGQKVGMLGTAQAVRDSWGPSLRVIQGTVPLVNESE